MKIKSMFTAIASVIIYSNLCLAAGTAVPACLDGGNLLGMNNNAVLGWKTSTKNQYHSRGHVQGTLVKVYPDHSGHHHYEVQIGANRNDTIEVIYNEQFGAVPQINPGTQMEACGDYITSNAPTGQYPASPDGAIIHWVHQSPNPRSHDSGYIVANGVVYGQNGSGTAP